MKRQLIDDWHQAWKWLSVNMLAAGAALPVAWAELPREWREAIPASWLAGAAIVIAAIGVYGRVTTPRPKPGPTDGAKP